MTIPPILDLSKGHASATKSNCRGINCPAMPFGERRRVRSLSAQITVHPCATRGRAFRPLPHAISKMGFPIAASATFVQNFLINGQACKKSASAFDSAGLLLPCIVSFHWMNVGTMQLSGPLEEASAVILHLAVIALVDVDVLPIGNRLFCILPQVRLQNA